MTGLGTVGAHKPLEKPNEGIPEHKSDASPSHALKYSIALPKPRRRLSRPENPITAGMDAATFTEAYRKCTALY